MNTLMDTLLNKGDQAITHIGLLNKLVDAVVSRITPSTIAAASCGQASIYCYSYCGENCYKVKVFKGYPTGNCGCEEETATRCAPC